MPVESRKSESLRRKKELHNKTLDDGVLQKEFKYSDHEDEFAVTLKQRDRDKILERNKRIRNEQVMRDISFGRMVATIPLYDLEILKRTHPELRNEAHPDFQKTLMRILNSPEGYKYRLQETI